jgi:hypothetical protein
MEEPFAAALRVIAATVFPIVGGPASSASTNRGIWTLMRIAAQDGSHAVAVSVMLLEVPNGGAI